ncbi:diadenosine tetraphosphate (Ap4A) HIT family hydrolase [Pseudacidovorax intermedius]|uniref:Diadenosine tetraphosphate (Ap4A) HIT family hydrolase n=1 Tax=Pseudacidovorax intermedius TaxID=433924 RepID=A0A370FJ12_9BURK|nr:HIT family protein [Pseudacidovorax intermedius]RDI26313.1 diadenosine tetraphosphate (Ap4A) HIT family hydrolase [Pseudacidovorax intermedius]
MSALAGCPLCAEPGGRVVAEGAQWRVIHAQEAGFPAFYRVVWTAHVAEFSDLSDDERAECMRVVVAVERALRDALAPAKMNVATLGNMVPHLHWHVISRFDWDSHFPSPVWAEARRARDMVREQGVQARLPAAESAMVAALALR